MSRLVLALPIFCLTALGLLVPGCGHQQVAVLPPPDPMAGWEWELPSPPPPPMAWVPAGPFRKAQRTPDDITAIVIHTTEGRFLDEQTHAENQMRNFVGNIRYFQGNDRNVSAHYVIGPNGEICHMVNDTDIAHTQTYYNGRGIGIECAGWGRRPETWTPEMMEALVNLTAYLCVKWEVPAYKPEGTAYEGPYSIRIDEDNQRFTGEGLVGHYQVQPWNKSDPGPHFDWEEFGERVRARIREYGHEPIPLPPPPTPETESAATARIVEEAIRPGEPFTYRITIRGRGAERVTPEHIILPDFTISPHLTVNSEPELVESGENLAVYEVKLTAAEATRFSLGASRIRIGRSWNDTQTINVRVEE